MTLLRVHLGAAARHCRIEAMLEAGCRPSQRCARDRSVPDATLSRGIRPKPSRCSMLRIQRLRCRRDLAPGFTELKNPRLHGLTDYDYGNTSMINMDNRDSTLGGYGGLQTGHSMNVT